MYVYIHAHMLHVCMLLTLHVCVCVHMLACYMYVYIFTCYICVCCSRVTCMCMYMWSPGVIIWDWVSPWTWIWLIVWTSWLENSRNLHVCVSPVLGLQPWVTTHGSSHACWWHKLNSSRLHSKHFINCTPPQAPDLACFLQLSLREDKGSGGLSDANDPSLERGIWKGANTYLQEYLETTRRHCLRLYMDVHV